MSSSKERKSKLSPKAQQIVDIVVTAIEALVVVVCIVVSVMVWVGVSDPANRSFNWFAIQTDSMMGTNPDSLNPGDLMFAKKVKNIGELQVGDVVAFKDNIRDSAGNWIENQIVTHRITRIVGNTIYTRGDNVAEEDFNGKGFDQIIGKYSGKWKGVGKVTLWLGGFKKVVTDEAKYADPNQLGGYGYEKSGSTTAFLVIIIPLALLFIYNGYVVAKWVLNERAKKIRAAALAEAQANAETSAADEAAIKRAALVEFMRGQGMTDEQIEAYFAMQQASQSASQADAAQAEQADLVDAEQQPEQIEEQANVPTADGAETIDDEDKPSDAE